MVEEEQCCEYSLIRDVAAASLSLEPSLALSDLERWICLKQCWLLQVVGLLDLEVEAQDCSDQAISDPCVQGL